MKERKAFLSDHLPFLVGVDDFAILSWNVLARTHVLKDGKNLIKTNNAWGCKEDLESFAIRQRQIAQMIGRIVRENPQTGIVALQEVSEGLKSSGQASLNHFIELLQEELPEWKAGISAAHYQRVGELNGYGTGESSPECYGNLILWDPRRFRFSPKSYTLPEQQEGRVIGGTMYREDKKGPPIELVNAHFRYIEIDSGDRHDKNWEANIESKRAAITQLHNQATNPLCVIGDMNCDPDAIDLRSFPCITAKPDSLAIWNNEWDATVLSLGSVDACLAESPIQLQDLKLSPQLDKTLRQGDFPTSSLQPSKRPASAARA